MVADVDPRAKEVVEYWFGPDELSKWALPANAHMSKWWRGGPEVDAEIIRRFTPLIDELAAGSLDGWLQHPVNAVAGVIVMDQFTRNSFRGDAKTYSLDSKARTWTKEILDTGRCAEQPVVHQFFLGMPLEHSEDIADQDRCVEYFKKLEQDVQAQVAAGNQAAQPLAAALGGFVTYAIKHQEVVAKWGRFPHRNAILGRESTPEEIKGLADGSITKF